jgi:hypothetical protein
MPHAESLEMLEDIEGSEMAVKTYNRIEKDKRPVGDIITRSGPPPLEQDYAVVEAILGSRRPAKCLSRSESVNMREDRDFRMMGIDTFNNGYVHRLEPLGPVEARDVEWIGALQARYPKSGLNLCDKYNGVSDDELADRYWRGELSGRPSVEHATKEAKVVSVEDQLSPVRPSKMAEALKRVAAYDEKSAKS